MIIRSEWGAKYGTGKVLSGRVSMVVIHHTAGAIAGPLGEQPAVRSIERHHVQGNGWQGIGYSFLVGPSGTVYEGRGWGRVGAHTQGLNSQAYGIAYMGNCEIEDPTDAAMEAIRSLIADGIHAGHITDSPDISGHRDHKATACPGARLYVRLSELHPTFDTSGDWVVVEQWEHNGTRVTIERQA